MRGALNTIPDSGQKAVARHYTRRVSARRHDWEVLTTRLADTLGCLEAGHFLILEGQGDPGYYVQFAAGGAEGMRVEAVSNRFLDGWQRLDRTAVARLRRLGWRPPTDIGEGPVNWWRTYDAPVPATEVAGLATTTLTKAFDLPRVDQLHYRAFSRDGGVILLPGLGLDHAVDEAPELALGARVDAILRDYLETDEVVYDSDGDCGIRHGEAMVFVRVVEDPGFVAVFSPVLRDVAPSPALLEAVNETNTQIRVARASLQNGVVVVAAEVDDGPGMQPHLVDALHTVASIANTCGEKLQARFGGTTWFGEPVDPPTTPAYGVYL